MVLWDNLWRYGCLGLDLATDLLVLQKYAAHVPVPSWKLFVLHQILQQMEIPPAADWGKYP